MASRANPVITIDVFLCVSIPTRYERSAFSSIVVHRAISPIIARSSPPSRRLTLLSAMLSILIYSRDKYPTFFRTPLPPREIRVIARLRRKSRIVSDFAAVLFTKTRLMRVTLRKSGKLSLSFLFIRRLLRPIDRADAVERANKQAESMKQFDELA